MAEQAREAADRARREHGGARNAVLEQRAIAAMMESTRLRIEAITQSLRDVSRMDDARPANE